LEEECEMPLGTVESYDVTEGKGYIILEGGGRFPVGAFMLRDVEKLEVGQRVVVKFTIQVADTDDNEIIESVWPYHYGMKMP
jgi:cold shock CspA family protein